jgi:hypothetical protein
MCSDISWVGPSGLTPAEVVRNASGPGGHGDTGEHVRIHHGGDMFNVWSDQEGGGGQSTVERCMWMYYRIHYGWRRREQQEGSTLERSEAV